MSQTKLLSTSQKDGNVIYTFDILIDGQTREFKIYDLDGEDRKERKVYAREQLKLWVKKNDGKFPEDKYLVLVSGGNFPVNDIQAYLSAKKKTSDLVRTNVTISAPLFEWSKAKVKKENTSFSDLVSRGLLILKESDKEDGSDKEVAAWQKEQRAYFRKKIGDFGSLEIFHYLPNNSTKFDADAIKNALQNSEQRRTGWPIGAYTSSGEVRPRPQKDGIKAEYPDTPHLIFDYWYAKDHGEFFLSRNLDSDAGHGRAEPKTLLYFDTLIWRVAESIDHCIAYYEALAVNKGEKVKVAISLFGINNRSLSAWNRGRAFTLSKYTCGSEESSWEGEFSLAKIDKEKDDVIYEIAKKLLVMFDFFVPNRKVVQSILDTEYRKSRM